MMEELFRDRQRQALRDVIELTADRGGAEVAIQQRYNADKQSNELDHETNRGRAESRRESDLADARGRFDGERERIEQVIASKRKGNDLEYEAERERIEDKAQANLQEAEKRRQETIWATETVYEAQKDNPRKQYEVLRRRLQDAVASLAAAETSCAAFMKRLFIGVPPQVEGAAAPMPDGGVDARELDTLLFELDRTASAGHDAAGRLLAQALARVIVGFMPALFLVILAGIGAGVGLVRAGGAPGRALGMGAAAGAGLGIVVLALIWVVTRRRSRTLLAEVRRRHAEIEALCASIDVKGQRQRDLDAAELKETRDNEVRKADDAFHPIHDEVIKRRDQRLADIDDAYQQRKVLLEERLASQLGELQQQFDERLGKVTRRSEEEIRRIESTYQQRKADIETRYRDDWTALERRWFGGMKSALDTVAALDEQCGRLFMPWDDPGWADWRPPRLAAPAIPFGRLAVDRSALDGGLARDRRLRLDAPSQFTLPASLVFPRDASLLLEYGDHGRDLAVRTLQAVMLRLLTCLPAGKVRFTIIDPVGLGESFAGFMHLADYDELLVTSRIWTEPRHIEQRLSDLTEHIENVIQKYLRSEFETIAQYNEKAGEIAEPYRFLVVSDLPAAFTEIAARRLASIVTSGPRCGLYALIGLDVRQKTPPGLELSDLRQCCRRVVFEKGRYVYRDEDYQRFPLTLETPPGDAFITQTLHKVGQAAKDTSRVEVPFDVITPRDGLVWSRSTASEITVPLGRAGATKLQSLELGHGTSQHVLIAGKTGSGKSTLLHALITNLSLWCSPDEVEFYLVDFKKGVEFKAYAMHALPHARVIAIESDREFGLSVLQRVDGELRRRGQVFRELQVQDLAGFRRARPGEPMPRVLLIIDEFQEFFTEDDKVAQDASLLLDRLVRQGRAFGIHVLLGSQTLGGAYSLARSTLGQMAVRIALQCSEADSYLILSDDNAAARLLARPGEAIYNNSNGSVEGNNPFQIAWLSDVTRDQKLRQIAELAHSRAYEPPDRQIVFEGNVPADVDRNHLLNKLLRRDDWPRDVAAVHVWLGDAIAIKDPTCVTFRRQSGSNLMIVGQRDEAALAMIAMSLVSLAAQHAPDAALICVLDGTAIDAPTAGYLQRLGAALPHELRHVGWRDVESTLAEISAECERRQTEDDTTARAIYVVVNGLQRYRMLRQADDFSFSMSDDRPARPDKLFATILREGPNFGIHTLLWCDTLTNLERVCDRAALREFDNRVLFQMSAQDSTNLIDSPAASKIGIRRALMFNEEQGQSEKFRPYALPDEHWLQQVRERLTARRPKVSEA